MNQEKLKQLQAQVRIGGKGTARRKKKVVHRTATTDDKKLQSSLKKLSVNNIPGIEEVNMIKDDGTVIHFNNPKVQASLAANTFAVTGHAENKQITEMLPGILNQLGAESLTHLKRLASNVTGGGTGAMEPGLEDDDDDEVPDLVENFDEVSKNEAATAVVVPEAAPEAEAAPEVEAATAKIVPEAAPEAEAAPLSKNEAATAVVAPEAAPEAEAAPEVEVATVAEVKEVSKNETATAEVVPEAAPETEAAPDVEAAPVAEVKDVEEGQPDGDGAKEE